MTLTFNFKVYFKINVNIQGQCQVKGLIHFKINVYIRQILLSKNMFQVSSEVYRSVMGGIMFRIHRGKNTEIRQLGVFSILLMENMFPNIVSSEIYRSVMGGRCVGK